MNQKGLAPLLIVLLIAAALGGYLIYQKQHQSQTKPVSNIETVTQSNTLESTPSPTTLPTYSACSYKGAQLKSQSFKREAYTGEDGGTYYHSSGIINVKGRIVTLPVMWYDRKTQAVFVRVKPGDEQTKEFYDEFIHLIEEGNGINKKDGEDLLFKLGELKNNSFITIADILPVVKSDIEKALSSKESLELKLSIPIPAGRGALSNESYACLIEEP